MNDEQVKRIFLEALDKKPADRGAYLDRVCGGARALRERVDALLRAHGDAGEFLGDGGTESETIGRYKLLQQIGEGGFGVVYMAEQTEPVERKVALKILKLGMDTKQIIARFEAERQALALMEHPNIAKVLDAGATDSGRPYFVMELVRGVPITEYCDKAKLGTGKRLELFMLVCQAVQHAHQKGIIHRDIKPSNILVTQHDGVPVPKVIDFGIAKATDRRLTDKTLFTEFQQMIGTPEYMAPEQAEISGLDVDTRADIYSLGVLLYELLTGTKPFDLKTLIQAGYEEILRTIREVDPPKPSTRISTMDDPQTVAQNRHTQPKLLGRLIRGDLDWIVMKALEKNRDRRYETANGFAMDIGRYLSNEPVSASPPSASYRVRKYVRRNKIAVAAVVAVLLALTVGAGVATAGFVEARAEARRANTILGFLKEMIAASSRDRKNGPNYTVREQLDEFDRKFKDQLASEPRAEAEVRVLMAEVFGGLGLADRTERHSDRALAAARQVVGPDHDLIADALRGKALAAELRGEYDAAVKFRREGLAMRRRMHGDWHFEVAEDLWHLGSALWLQPDFAAADEAAHECMAILKRLYGEHHGEIADTMVLLGTIAFARGDLADSVEWYEKARTMHEELGLDEEPRQVGLLNYLAIAYAARGDKEPAIDCVKAAQALTPRYFSEAHPLSVANYKTLGEVYMRLHDAGKAVAAYEKAVELAAHAYGTDSRHYGGTVAQYGHALLEAGQPRRVVELLKPIEPLMRRHAPGHHDLGAFLSILGSAHLGIGEISDAERCYRDALAIESNLLGRQNIATAMAAGNLADIESARGDHAGAVKHSRHAVAIHERQLGRDNPLTIHAISRLGQHLRNAGSLDEALDMSRNALDRARRHHPDHPVRAICENNVATLLPDAQAAPHLRAAAELMRKVHGEEHPLTKQVTHNLGLTLARAGQHEEAARIFEWSLPLVPLFLVRQPDMQPSTYATMCVAFLETERHALAEEAGRASLAVGRKAFPKEHPEVAQGCVLVGVALMRQDKFKEAEPFLVEGLETRVKAFPPHVWMIPNAKSLLGACYLGQGLHEKAEPLLLAGYNDMDAKQAPPIRKKEALERIIRLYDSWKKPDKAKEWRAKLGR